MKKIYTSDTNLDDLLKTLQITGEPIKKHEENILDDSTYDEQSSFEEDNLNITEILNEDRKAENFSLEKFIENGTYKISGGDLPFSLFDIASKTNKEYKTKKELNVKYLENPIIEVKNLKRRYTFTKEDINKYRMKKRVKIRKTCDTWDEIEEKEKNAPKKLNFRTLFTKK